MQRIETAAVDEGGWPSSMAASLAAFVADHFSRPVRRRLSITLRPSRGLANARDPYLQRLIVATDAAHTNHFAHFVDVTRMGVLGRLFLAAPLSTLALVRTAARGEPAGRGAIASRPSPPRPESRGADQRAPGVLRRSRSGAANRPRCRASRRKRPPGSRRDTSGPGRSCSPHQERERPAELRRRARRALAGSTFALIITSSVATPASRAARRPG